MDPKDQTETPDQAEDAAAQEDTKQEAEGEEEEEVFETNWFESVDNFDDLGLKEEVLRGIYGYGFERPSPIQKLGVLPVIKGRDTIAQA